MKIIILNFLLFITLSSFAQERVKVILDATQYGTYDVTPNISHDGMVNKGTVLTIKAKANEGYVFDSSYNTGKGPWSPYYYESMKPESTIIVNESMHIGSSFIRKELVENLNVTQDVIYAKPGVKALKYDVYAPKEAKNLPCIIIIHGGGWRGNTEDIMRGLARELANSGRYVVFSIDYRWIENYDGDDKPTKMYQIIEDVYGAIAHIREHAKQYGADANKLFLTGDSAGGHLAAAAIDFVERLGNGGFGNTKGVYEFYPTYMPKGESVSQLKKELSKSILGAVPSYAVLNSARLGHYMEKEGEEAINAVTPACYIPDVSKRAVPQLLFRGTEDPIISDNAVMTYQKALVNAGQRAEYIQVGGASHAFFDWKPDEMTKATFKKYGEFHASQMLHFFDSILSGLK